MTDIPKTPPDQTTPVRRLRAPVPPSGEPAARRTVAAPPAGAGRVERLPEDDVTDRGPPEPVVPVTFNLDDVEDFEAREGDVLVVTYPEVTLPTSTKFLMVKVGGTIYTRRLIKGESAKEQFEKVYRFIAAASERTARAKLALYVGEMRTAREAT